MKKIIFLSLFIFLNTVTVVAQNEEEFPDKIEVDKLLELMSTDSTLIILDVRRPSELVGPLGQIENVINIPLQELEDEFEEIEKYRENKIAVICRSGRRSGIATDMLREKGFQAANVLGGMIEYNNVKNETDPEEE